MKCTQYFLHTRERSDRKIIEMEWILRTIEKPDAEYVQEDGRIRRWRMIPEADDRYLRVILLSDGKTIHNAFFDRRFKQRS
jgi:hypothetical protein